MESCAGILIPEMTTGSDSTRVSGDTFDCRAKVKGSGLESSLQPCSNRTAPNNHMLSGNNRFPDLFMGLSWIGPGDSCQCRRPSGNAVWTKKHFGGAKSVFRGMKLAVRGSVGRGERFTLGAGGRLSTAPSSRLVR